MNHIFLGMNNSFGLFILFSIVILTSLGICFIIGYVALVIYSSFNRLTKK
jgi:hypothetical protein